MHIYSAAPPGSGICCAYTYICKAEAKAVLVRESSQSISHTHDMFPGRVFVEQGVHMCVDVQQFLGWAGEWVFAVGHSWCLHATRDLSVL